MKKEEVGYVIDTENDIAKIKVGRHSDCKNCGSCPGNSSIILNVKNPIGAEIGQKIAFETKESNMLTSVYIVYMQPIVFVFLGIYLGYLSAHYLHESIKAFESIFGIIAFSLSLIYIRFVEKKLAGNKNNMPIITKIIS
ncbi:MAG: SoxR reducing system RseC family protein [Peptostreptococcaceae bacterium]